MFRAGAVFVSATVIVFLEVVYKLMLIVSFFLLQILQFFSHHHLLFSSTRVALNCIFLKSDALTGL